LILFGNIDTLYLNGEQVQFGVKLKLTGVNITGSIVLPVSETDLTRFLAVNQTVFSTSQQKIIRTLNVEAHTNHLQIEITGNMEI